MKPELLLFLRLYADQFALIHSVHEAVIPLYLKEIKNVPEQSHQQLHSMSLDAAQNNADRMFAVLLEFLENYYPTTFVSENGKKESIEELKKKVSLIMQNYKEN